MREDTRAKCNLLVEIALREAIAAELELRRLVRVEVRVENTERVEVGNMVAAHLVGTDEQLDLRANASIKLAQ